MQKRYALEKSINGKVVTTKIFSCIDGNLYGRDDEDGKFWLIDGYDYEDLEYFVEIGKELIFVEGPDSPLTLDI